ncbi:potassium channel subfamily K member 4-like [Argonauta hians]
MESNSQGEKDTDMVSVGEAGKRDGCCCFCCCKRNTTSLEAPKSGPNKASRCCSKLITFLFSHIGLSFLVVAYSVLGGYLFMKIEKPFEITQRSNVGKIRSLAVNRLWNYTENLNILKEEHWKQKVDEKLRYFQLEVVKAIKQGGWDGNDDVSEEREAQWSFAGSLLFSVTIITTIGYGNIAPKTVIGRLTAVAYAIFGIPLTLLCLANVGSLLASIFRVFYFQVLCCKCCFRSKKQHQQPVVQSAIDTCETSDGIKPTPKDVVVYSNDKSSKDEDRNIPVVVTLFIMILYLICGTLLFTMWENDWDYVEGFYFCFITLSTIGFGDFVPGASLDEDSNQSKRIICTVYLVLGLALVAMCFELMQAQVRYTFRKLAERIGIIKAKQPVPVRLV